MINKLRKVKCSLMRSGKFKASLTPLDPKTVHPVYSAHARVLQPLTRPIGFSKLVHVIGRPNQYFLNNDYSFISEVEGGAGVAPKKFSKNYYDIEAASHYTNNLIEQGRLKSIIYQSKPALELHSKQASPLMNSISKVITQVPYEYSFTESITVRKKFNLLVIASNPKAKGVFLYKKLLDYLSLHKFYVNLKIVTSKPCSFEVDELHCVEFMVIPRLGEIDKYQLFDWCDFLINLSPMDTLGTFLDSLMYGKPLITVEGQHASSYLNNNITGFSFQSPLFYYGDKLGIKYHDVKKSFVDYVYSLDDGFWDDLIISVGKQLLNLDDSDVRTMTNNHREYITECHKIENWVLKNQELYEECSV